MTLPSLTEVMRSYGLQPTKSLGQNFLLDTNITEKIVRKAGDVRQKYVIEVGPGPGGLTRALLAGGAFVLAIEQDERCVRALDILKEYYPEHLQIIHGDALKVDEKELLTKCFSHYTGKAPSIVANLPYNIGTTLLLKWLHQPAYEQMTLMFQKEVADRIMATPGTKAFGRLSLLSQLYYTARKEFDLPPSAFTPPPKVTSTVITLLPLHSYYTEEFIKIYERLTQILFSQRRKTLGAIFRNNLKEAIPLLTLLQIDAQRRPETLTLREMIALAEHYHKL